MKGLFTKNKKEAEAIAVGEFAHQNKHLIVIVADPKDDTIFVAYNDSFVSGRIRGMEGDKVHILRDLMASARLFDSEIDRFLMGLVEVLKIRRLSVGVNNFLQYLDGALYNISRRHREKVLTDVPEGSVKSPLTVGDVVDPGSSHLLK